MLSVEETAALLTLTGTDMRDFFWGTFPPGGDLERALLADQKLTVHGLSSNELWKEVAKRTPLPRPCEIVSRAAALLQGYLAHAERSHKAVSQEFFGTDDLIRNALSGRSELRFEVVFSVLVAVDEEPWRFFVHLLGPENETLAPGISWWDLLNRLDGIDRRGLEGLASEHSRWMLKTQPEAEEQDTDHRQ